MNDPACIQALTVAHARSAARLHRTGIDTGFLSSLGAGFLGQLYAALPRCPAAFGFVAVDDRGSVVGFVACAESTGRLYKQALLRRGLLMAASLVRFVVRPATLKRMWETLRYPCDVDAALPDAEVLSIAVDQDARGQGLGTALIETALAEFAHRGISRVKVAVWSENQAANALYQRCGFVLAGTRNHHGLATNLYVAETTPQG